MQEPESKESISSLVFDQDALTKSIPAHLLEPNWLEFEYRTALSVIESLRKEVKPFEHNLKNKTIHNIRIAFRRWFSIWEVLKEDGFQTDKFEKKLGKKLKRFYKLLGRIRDWDVNCKLAQKEGLPSSIRKAWSKQREKERRECFKQIRNYDLISLIKKLKRYLGQRFEKLKVEFIRYQGAREATVFSHLESYLALNEYLTRDLSKELLVMEDIHNLRLKIKSWRYLLVEYYGISLLALVDAQKYLGQIVDYDRIRILLELRNIQIATRGDLDQIAEVEATISQVVDKRNSLIKELDSLKTALPYGFRPFSSSLT